jgi:hypothetical protein
MDDVQEACYDVIKGLCRQMGKDIMIGHIGLVMTDDTATLGYYLVLFTSDTFSFHPGNIREVVNATQQLEKGSLVVRIQSYLPMKGAPLWYVPPNKKGSQPVVLSTDSTHW